VHDVGGDEATVGRPIDWANPPLLHWEHRAHALFAVLASQRWVGTDELRRAIEGLTPDQYNEWTYYEKWTAALVTLLLEKNLVTEADLRAALFGESPPDGSDTESTAVPRFVTGDAVRVKSFDDAVAWQRPHLRTPGYVYGVHGVVERVAGRHHDPSYLAFGWEAPLRQLYRVRFRAVDLWPEQTTASLSLNADQEDVVEVEIYEHWLEAATASTGHEYADQLLLDHSAGDDCNHDDHATDTTATSHHHSHHHHHHGDDIDDDGDHSHDPRPMVEERAVRQEGPPRPGQALHDALYHCVRQNNLATAAQVQQMMTRLEAAGRELAGATLVVHAWTDPAFRTRLLEGPTAAAAEVGIVTANPNAPTVLTVVANTPDTHNLVVCTLCSCYPSGLLGIAPSWYKSRTYRARAVREPRAVLADFGTTLPRTTRRIRVHDSTADHRYLVLPLRPSHTAGWSTEDLRALVTRDCMIGVAVA
jgi:nitrile hydratase